MRRFHTISSHCTMVQNSLKLGHQNLHCPTSLGASERASEQMRERSGASEQSEQCGASERVGGASDHENGRASGSVQTPRFLAVQNHRAAQERCPMQSLAPEQRASPWPQSNVTTRASVVNPKTNIRSCCKMRQRMFLREGFATMALDQDCIRCYFGLKD